MSLTKAEAKEITAAVSNDPECLRRIQHGNIVADMIPNSLGINGAVRNWGLVGCNIVTGGRRCDPIDKKTADIVCTGITDATVNAIDAARMCRVALIGRVVNVAPISRIGTMGVAHTATQIFMDDGTDYVFDWHATLNPTNPMISKTADWKTSSGGVTLTNFKGF